MTYDDKRHIRARALEAALVWQRNHVEAHKNSNYDTDALKTDELLATARLFERYIDRGRTETTR